ncbi:MAG: hypothetical protein ABEJ69_00885 [Candidatus Nanohaloarchaea archaeon]
MLLLGLIFTFIGNLQGQTARDRDVRMLNKLGEKAATKCDDAVNTEGSSSVALTWNNEFEIQDAQKVTLERKSTKRAFLKLVYPGETKSKTYELTGCKYKLKDAKNGDHALDKGEWNIKIEASGNSPVKITITGTKP